MITASWANTANLLRNRQEKVVMEKVHPAIIPGFSLFGDYSVMLA